MIGEVRGDGFYRIVEGVSFVWVLNGQFLCEGGVEFSSIKDGDIALA